MHEFTWIIHNVKLIGSPLFGRLDLVVSQPSLSQALSLAMLPALVSAMCACTWHFFDNPESLEWLVTLQATMTLVATSILGGCLVVGVPSSLPMLSNLVKAP